MKIKYSLIKQVYQKIKSRDNKKKMIFNKSQVRRQKPPQGPGKNSVIEYTKYKQDQHIKGNSNNNNNRQEQLNSKMDEDDVVRQLMTLLGNKKQLHIKSNDGKTIKVSFDHLQDHDQSTLDNNLENQLNIANSIKDITTPRHQQEQYEFQKYLSETGNSNEILPIKNKCDQSTTNSTKKVSLNSKKNKVTTNEAVLQFIDKKNINNICVNSQTLTKKNELKNATQSIQFLKQNHPEDKQHLQLISQRMMQLQKMEQDKMKLDEEISSILSASFSNSISGMKFDSSIDASIISLSALSISGTNDPLCQIFSNYLKRNAVNKKSSSQKMPSFLFLYSQPMLDYKGNQINDQINYFQQQSIIQKALKQCKIDYIKEQGTVEKFNYWIKQNISIIHFCGHGVPDYLLFQGPAGLSVKLDSQNLQKILKQLQNPLQLVFVASCHSESAGKIFKQAGAVHVICIKDKYSILDEACHEFARIFYRLCINDKMSICDAFGFAKKQLSLSQKFNSHECSKFILIKDHCEQNCKSKLDIAKQGEFRDLTFKPYYCKFMPSRVQNFIPRPKDLHEILKLIDSKNRFISVTGHSGIGKSTLIRQLVRYIQFRNNFKDGVIYLDIRSCEKISKIFQIITMEMFQSCPTKLNKTFGENTQRIVKQIQQRQILIVMDNCQNIMLSEEKNQFKKLIQIIMKNCDNVYFVFTNRSGIGRQIDYCSEKLYQLGRLTDLQAQTLFFLRVPRTIEKSELQQFLKVGKVIDFSKHPFFEFLNGHPQAICMTASLLSDRSLCELYQLLMKPSLQKVLPKQKIDDDNVGVNPLVQTAMKISLNVLKNKYKDSSQMIKTLSLLPIGADSQTMAKLFREKWKETAKRLIDHSLIHCREIVGSKYYAVHPYIIIYIESEITQDQKLKYHQKICDEFLKRIQKVYRHVGTLSQSSQRAQEQFFAEHENYKAIILRELSFYGQKSKIRRLYYNLFQADYSDQQFIDKEEESLSLKMKSQAIQGINKKRIYNQKILQPTKKDSITLLLVYYATILFVTKNQTCSEYIELGIVISRMKNKLISEANLLRIKGCLFLIKNKYAQAKENYIKSWELYAIEGCGVGSASCQSAIGYIRLFEQQYAPAKKNMQSALKYYDSIAHPFGKHYLNRWLCTLKTKMNRTQKQLISHREQAQKLLKQTKLSLKSSNINNTSLIKHKLGIFVFRFAFDNISLFLETSWEVDVRPKIINEVTLKKTQERGSKNHQEQFYNQQQQILVSLNKNEPNKNEIAKKNPYKRK